MSLEIQLSTERTDAKFRNPNPCVVRSCDRSGTVSTYVVVVLVMWDRGHGDWTGHGLVGNRRLGDLVRGYCSSARWIDRGIVVGVVYRRCCWHHRDKVLQSKMPQV